MTPFTGQTENAGHFLQPTTNVIGHKVIALLLRSLRVHQAEREDAHGRYCGRVGVGMQRNMNGIRGCRGTGRASARRIPKTVV